MIRLWTEPPRKYLRGGLGLLPLAPLCMQPRDVSEERLRPIVNQVIRRLDVDAIPEERAKLLVATYLLLGVKTEREVIDRLFEKVTDMEESTTYQAVIRKGMVKKAHETILNLGTRRFGSPSKAAREEILAIVELERLDEIETRLLDVSSWDELLQTP